ncbi:MAG TPA: ABC transporter ATP-binding protein [Acidimicrobiia bacterium]|nr:ABC transporter ATP-binding protein [Acidimicrobiia bacterium]
MVLEIDDLSVRFGAHRALDSLDLTVDDGEVVAVLGPSGSGKSTLLRAIAGLVPLDGGRIVHDGRDLAGVAPHQRGFGLMFQDHALFPHLDVLGNVGFGLRMRGDAPKDVAARATTVIETVGLVGAEHRRVHELSGGEQQRVALARALAPEPDLLMLDEPLGSLDRALRELLAQELATLFTRIGLSALVVTHDQDEAFALADRIAVVDRGRLVQVGTPPDLWRRPATRFVAEFLGWTVTDALDGGMVAIRPDAAKVVPSDPLPSGARTGVVVMRTPRRDHWRLRIRVDDAPTPWELDVEERAPAAPMPGAAVAFSIDPEGVIRL